MKNLNVSRSFMATVQIKNMQKAGLKKSEYENPETVADFFAALWENSGNGRTCAVAVCLSKGGLYHLHMALYSKSPSTIKKVAAILFQSHVEIQRGGKRELQQYLKKEGKYEEKGEQVLLLKNVENVRDNQGLRSDLEEIYDYVKAGKTDAEIIEMVGDAALRSIHLIEKYRQTYLRDKYKGTRRLDISVNYITGATGMGKTRDILDQFGDRNVYRVTDYLHPFDGYDCQDVIVFEEFRSSLRLQDMLSYLDIYPVDLPARYANKTAMYHFVFVCSNWSFEQQYAELQKDPEQNSTYAAWCRRFNGVVKEYKKDGRIIVYESLQKYTLQEADFIPLSDHEEAPF